MNHHEVLKEFRVKKASNAKAKRTRKKEFEMDMSLIRDSGGSQERKEQRTRVAVQAMTERELKDMAVKLFMKLGTLGGVAKQLDRKRATLERWMIEDPTFCEDMVDAFETVMDRLERKAMRRALVDESDEMLKFLLRAGRPAKFNPQAMIAAEAALAASSAANGGAGAGGSGGQKFRIAGQEVEF